MKKVILSNLKQQFIGQGTVSELRKLAGLDAESVADEVTRCLHE